MHLQLWPIQLGIYSYGLRRYGLHSYGPHSYGLISYGQHSYGLCRGAQHRVLVRTSLRLQAMIGHVFRRVSGPCGQSWAVVADSPGVYLVGQHCLMSQHYLAANTARWANTA